MNRKITWLLIILVMALSLVCTITLFALVWIRPSFPQFLFGQLQLTRDSAPLSPRAYQSAEFILDQVEFNEIERGEYIHLQDDVLFWDPAYPGFPRTELSKAEIRQIQEVLSGGKLFRQSYPEDGFSCVTISPGGEPGYKSCPEGKEYWDQLQDLRFEATLDREVGLFLFSLTNGGVAEIRIFPGEGGTGFNPKEKGGEWWFDGISAPVPGLEKIISRTIVEPIEVLWPHKNAAKVYTRGRRIFGFMYQLALDTIQDSTKVEEVFGEIEQIRPAVGNNYYSSWMDSTSIFLTFYIAGSKGSGVATVQGCECYQIRLVFEGTPVPGRLDMVCP